MSTVQKVAFTVVILVLAAVIAFCWLGWSITQQDLNSVRTELTSVQASLESGKLELSVAKDKLSVTRTQLEATKGYLSNVEGELQGTKDYLSTVEAEFEATKAKLSSIQTDALHLHNPTLEEAIIFLREDKTEANKYVEGEYVCVHFARDVDNNAESRGIRCAYVDIRYPKVAHAIIAFDTTDEGMVYFDPSSDDRVRPVIGKQYWRCVEHKPGHYYQKPSYDDTITALISNLVTRRDS
ncbi:hypothetical protein ACFLV4_00450 [Chloroflexota bacterium]